MSVTPKPPVAKDARSHQAVPFRVTAGLQEARATVRSHASPMAIQAVTLAKAAMLVKAVTVAQTAIAGKGAMLAKAVTVAQTAIAGKGATRAAATTAEVSTRRRTATESSRPEMHRECPPAGAASAIVLHASVATVMVVDIAADTMA